jgi:hypothetical protein
MLYVNNDVNTSADAASIGTSNIIITSLTRKHLEAVGTYLGAMSRHLGGVTE